MRWNDHSNLDGRHSFLSPSHPSWLEWDEDTIEQRYYGQYSQLIGTTIHEVAENLIKNRRKLHKYDHLVVEYNLDLVNVPRFAYDTSLILPNLMAFVNDANGFNMDPEKKLYYSENCFGTADAISYDMSKNFLRIFDYKSGLTPAKMEQPLIYAALFVLEYLPSPKVFANLQTELRIYQNVVEGDEVTPNITTCNPTPDEIASFMNKIRKGDDIINHILERERL